MPTDVEWTTLENYLIANGYNYDGSTSGNYIAKALAANAGWSSSYNTGAIGNDLSINNSTGFFAFPGGFRYNSGSFAYFLVNGYWWSATESSTDNAQFRALYFQSAILGSYSNPKEQGFSVRCVRD